MRKKSKVGKRRPGKTLAIPTGIDDPELSDEDLQLLEEFGGAASFLTRLNPEVLSRKVALQAPLPSRKSLAADPDLPDIDSESASEHESVEEAGDIDSEDDSEAFDDADDYEDVHRRPQKKKRENADEMEAEYEQNPRLSKAANTSDFDEPSITTNGITRRSAALPVIDSTGQLVKQNKTLEVNMDAAFAITADHRAQKMSKRDKKSVAAEERNKAVATPLKPEQDARVENGTSSSGQASAEAEPPKNPKARRVFLQEQLAEAASLVLADPEKNIATLSRLRRYVTDESDQHIKQLALLTLLAVYKDVIPGYAIRPLTEKEKTAKVSKEVKALRNFEESLVSNYQSYLQTIEQIISKSSKATYGTFLAAVKCVAGLLATVTHFNYRINLMTLAVNVLTSNTSIEIIVLLTDAFATVFQNDEEGLHSLEALKALSKGIKRVGYVVNERVLSTFLHLRLVEELSTDTLNGSAPQPTVTRGKRKRNAEKEHISKRMKKALKKDKEVEEEMREAEAVVDKEELQKRQAETLKIVFVAYLRILRNSQSRACLSAVFAGITRFAHLINVDVYTDLITVLRGICENILKEDEQALTHSDARCALHGVVAALQLATGQGQGLNIDMREFAFMFYRLLLQLPMVSDVPCPQQPTQNPKASGDISTGPLRLLSVAELAVMGLNILFSQKQSGITRLASFVKRLALVSLHVPSNTAIACLTVIRLLFVKFPKLGNLLSSDSAIGTGVYQPTLDDPDLANPFTTNLWELSAFKTHYHPVVRTLAHHILASVSDQESLVNTVTKIKSVPPELNYPAATLLRRYSWLQQNQNGSRSEDGASCLRLAFVPPMEMPKNITASIQRSKTKGIRIRAHDFMGMMDDDFSTEDELHCQQALLKYFDDHILNA
ncbi:nucleolar complex-associated protein-domain-containing protein [Cladochytrium replicatum]|nr:nucleolar complex-associated protein-domain-containing protein [Cladochytrium replicatum]